MVGLHTCCLNILNTRYTCNPNCNQGSCPGAASATRRPGGAKRREGTAWAPRTGPALAVRECWQCALTCASRWHAARLIARPASSCSTPAAMSLHGPDHVRTRQLPIHVSANYESKQRYDPGLSPRTSPSGGQSHSRHPTSSDAPSRSILICHVIVLITHHRYQHPGSGRTDPKPPPQRLGGDRALINLPMPNVFLPGPLKEIVSTGPSCCHRCVPTRG